MPSLVQCSTYGGITQKWQDWASFALGLWLAVSPWMAGYVEHNAATANAVDRRPGARARLATSSAWPATSCPLNGSTSPWAYGWCARRSAFGFGSPVATANSHHGGRLVAVLACSALSLDKQIGKLWHKAH